MVLEVPPIAAAFGFTPVGWAEYGIAPVSYTHLKTCGETVKKGEIIPATGHDTQVVGAKPATCTQDGYTCLLYTSFQRLPHHAL